MRWHRLHDGAFFLLALGLLVAQAGLVYVVTPGLQRARKVVAHQIQQRMPAVRGAMFTARLDVPYHRQEHALSCEVATLQMVLNYRGVAVTEAELIAQLPFATREPRGPGNTWGDPQQGFVGSLDGRMPNTGYGVYEGPIVALARGFRPAEVMTGASLTTLLELIAAGHPVIVWGTLSSGRDISWTTPDGARVTAIDGEHTRVLIGFTGPLERPRSVLLLDPIYGSMTMSRARFLANWALLGNKAVVVY